jgi:hypothetical protein
MVSTLVAIASAIDKKDIAFVVNTINAAVLLYMALKQFPPKQ